MSPKNLQNWGLTSITYPLLTSLLLQLFIQQVNKLIIALYLLEPFTASSTVCLKPGISTPPGIVSKEYWCIVALCPISSVERTVGTWLPKQGYISSPFYLDNITVVIVFPAPGPGDIIIQVNDKWHWWIFTECIYLPTTRTSSILLSTLVEP